MEIYDFKCKYCGADLENIDGRHSVATCKYCGKKQTLPKLPDQRRVDLFGRANHLRRHHQFDKAEGLYEQILTEDPNDPEAYWSLVLCRFGIVYVQDPKTGERIPTVNRTQATSIFGDENYQSALEFADEEQHALYEHEAGVINDIQRGILEISQNEEPFDVFICYKETDDKTGKRTQDSVLGYDLYRELTREGYKVFFSRVTLEDKLGTAYEPYIYAALNSAKVMVVIGTKPENFNAAWVKNEWSRFLSLVRESDGEKVLIPAYRDMDPYDLPEEFAHLQAQDMSKIGFMQDIVHGIQKILPVDASTVPLPERGRGSSREKRKKKLLILGAACVAVVGIGVTLLLTVILPSIQRANWRNQYGDSLLIATSKEMPYLQVQNGTVISATDCPTDLVIPHVYNGEVVTQIAGNAFRDNSVITSVTIPNSVTYIGDWAFENCKIQKATAPTYALSSIPSSVLKEVIIVGGTSIDANMFDDCSSLMSVTIGDSVTSIGDDAFYGHSNLTNITIGDSVTSIGDDAFRGCSSLTNITIGDSVTSIGDYAFRGCSSLTSITIPDSVTSIGDYAFEYCSNLTSITIPSGMTSIGDGAFQYCSTLKSITIPNSVESIGNGAFYACSGIVNITVDAGNTVYHTAGNCLIETAGKTLLVGCQTSVIPTDGSVTIIGDSAFSGCSNLTDITIPATITTIGNSAFSGCGSLTSVYITDIEAWCNIEFKQADSNPLNYAHNLYLNGELVTELVIPDSVTNIGNSAFYGCRCLTNITIPDSVTSIGQFAFRGCSSLTSITIPAGVTSIGNQTFYNCNSLGSVTIPAGVTSIDNTAFYNCGSLTSITIPDSVTRIGRDAFSYCIGLTSITFQGTTAEWEAISKGGSWDSKTPTYTIHCTDGDIPKS